MNEQRKDAKPWLRRRHAVARTLLGPLVALITRLKYRVRADKFREQEDGPYLILYNHQTPFDQFFVMTSFRGPVYYLATEDIFSNGWISSVIRWLVAPIPIRKQTLDMEAMRTIMKVVKEGGTLAIAPEGNRTYSGKTEYMNPSIARLAKKIHLPIVLYRIEGGYGVQPRWSDRIRKGRMHAYVSRVIRPEEYDSMSKEALFEAIRDGLYVNEAVSDAEFLSRRKAEFLERAIYVCPECGLSTFFSRGDETECLTCHKKVRYFADKHMEGVGWDFPFRYVNDWYEYQKAFVNRLDLTEHTAEPLYRDQARISEVIVYQRKELQREKAELRLYGDRIEVDADWCLPFSEVSAMAVLGRNKLNVYHADKIYQFKGDAHFNALKYMNLYYRYRNQMDGENNGEFLGL